MRRAISADDLSTWGIDLAQLGPTGLTVFEDSFLSFGEFHGLTVVKPNTYQLPARFPEEDSVLHAVNDDTRKVCLVVADGIPEDPLASLGENEDDDSFFERRHLPYPDQPEDFRRRWLDRLPEYSLGKVVSWVFVRELVQSLLSYRGSNRASLLPAFKMANFSIKHLNAQLGLTAWTDNGLDLRRGGCMASVALVSFRRSRAILNWGFLGDCGVRVYDRFGIEKFASPDEIVGPTYFHEQRLGWDWYHPYGRFLEMRYQTNVWPPIALNGKCMTRGSINGDPQAAYYWNSGQINLEKGDWVVVHSDGALRFIGEQLGPILKELVDQPSKVLNWVLENYGEDNQKYRSEGTLALGYVNF